MEDLNNHVVHAVFAYGFNDGIFTYHREGDWVIGDDRFAGPAKAVDGELRLQFRFSPPARCVGSGSASRSASRSPRGS